MKVAAMVYVGSVPGMTTNIDATLARSGLSAWHAFCSAIGTLGTWSGEDPAPSLAPTSKPVLPSATVRCS